VLQQMRSKGFGLIVWSIIGIVFVGAFVFYDASGLMNQGAVTTSTVVAEVNGDDILYTTWANTAASMAQQQEQQQGRGLTLDERRQIDDQAFNELVNDLLLQAEYRRRGIRVSDEEIVQMAQNVPPQQFQQLPELQTDGRFDIVKYRRFISSSGARQQGILVTLENYYRTEIPRTKLFQQIAGDEYVSDTRLWSIWKDTHDSATVSYVAFRPTPGKVHSDAVTEADIKAHYDSRKSEFDRPGLAVMSIVSISRRPTAADSAEMLTKVRALREEIAKGAKFEDVARRESDDSVSAANGGQLPKSVRGTYVKAFNDAVFSAPVGVLSQPLRTEFGYHIFRVDKRQGDSVWVHHILKLYRQGDSSAVRTDRLADTLSKGTAGATDPKVFDDVTKRMGLLVSRISATEGQPAQYLGSQVPSASAWAFGGARPGETSELFDDDNGYYLARLDSLRPGGVQPLDVVRDEIRTLLASKKAIEAALPAAQALSKAAAGSTLEAAAKAANLTVEKHGPFTRSTPVPAFGFVSEVTGAAFTLPVGSVSEPVKTDEALFVVRVDKRVPTDSIKWVVQKPMQRQQVQESMRNQKVRLFLNNLRKAAKVEDRRAEINAALRRVSA
jgi:peptidyl-prolyl cis-trans isomerase D